MKRQGLALPGAIAAMALLSSAAQAAGMGHASGGCASRHLDGALTSTSSSRRRSAWQSASTTKASRAAAASSRWEHRGAVEPAPRSGSCSPVQFAVERNAKPGRFVVVNDHIVVGGELRVRRCLRSEAGGGDVEADELGGAPGEGPGRPPAPWPGVIASLGVLRRPSVMASAVRRWGRRWLGCSKRQSWRSEPTPKVGKFNIGSFDAVSCATATDCTAVGQYLVHREDDDHGTLAEHWNGTRWQVRGKLGPASQGTLEGISCPRGGACLAVGAVGLDQGQPGVPIARRWNGRRWVAMAVGVRGSGGQLEGVSCSSARSCIAVGLQAVGEFASPQREVLPKSMQLIVERYDGRRWTPQRAPEVTATFNQFDSRPLAVVLPSLTSVSCLTAGTCVAVGGRLSGHHTRPIAEATAG